MLKSGTSAQDPTAGRKEETGHCYWQSQKCVCDLEAGLEQHHKCSSTDKQRCEKLKSYFILVVRWAVWHTRYWTFGEDSCEVDVKHGMSTKFMDELRGKRSAVNADFLLHAAAGSFSKALHPVRELPRSIAGANFWEVSDFN